MAGRTNGSVTILTPRLRSLAIISSTLVSRHAQTLLAELRDADGRGLPRHIERELAEYLRCGILAHGFARVRCTTCHEEIVVAFSCKRRGLCPSCTARRMADTAAHLVDHVLPRAPYRHYAERRIMRILALASARAAEMPRLGALQAGVTGLHNAST